MFLLFPFRSLMSMTTFAGALQAVRSFQLNQPRGWPKGFLNPTCPHGNLSGSGSWMCYPKSRFSFGNYAIMRFHLEELYCEEDFLLIQCVLLTYLRLRILNIYLQAVSLLLMSGNRPQNMDGFPSLLF